jgi:hypothetical protein
MKKILLILIISFLFFNCKSESDYSNNTELCKILEKMTEDDQKIRGLPKLSDSFFEILDSIRKANNLTKEIYIKLSKKEQLKWEQVAREIANKRPEQSKKELDSLWGRQTKLDNHNTELLINIVKKRGWVDKMSLNCKEYAATWVIFRHSQEKYWNQIRPLIEKAYKEKKLGGMEYAMIDNQLKGRPSFKFDWEKK